MFPALRVHDAQREGHRHRRVDGIAAFAQHFEACFGGKRVDAGHHRFRESRGLADHRPFRLNAQTALGYLLWKRGGAEQQDR